MPVEKAAEITGIPAEKIVEAARMYAAGTPSALQWGLAIDQKANGMQAGHCIVDLMAITGNIDVPGGQILSDINFGLNEVGFGIDKGVGKELMDKMIGLDKYPAYCNTILNAHADMMLETIETGKPYPIKFGFYPETT
jgi:anaerobic selenocysteine-containing dehydrogenase